MTKRICTFMPLNFSTAIRCCLTAMVFILVSGLASFAEETQSIEGHITYRERIALPPGSVIDIRLMEANDDQTQMIARAAHTVEAQVPIPFSLGIDPALLESGHKYYLQASIFSGEILWFISDQPVYIDPENIQSDYAMMLTMVQQGNFLADTELQLQEQIWIVERLGQISNADTDNMTLRITDDGQVFGFGGCNRFTAQAEIDENTIAFSQANLSFMICSDKIMANERKFIDILRQTKTWAIKQRHLYLYSAHGQVLAILVSDTMSNN